MSPTDWRAFVTSSKRLWHMAIETAVESKRDKILSKILPGSEYKNIGRLIRLSLSKGDGGCLKILLNGRKFSTDTILKFFERAGDLLADERITVHEYMSACSALITYCPVSRARIGRILSLEGNPVFIQLLTDAQKADAQKLQREVLTQLLHKDTLLDLLSKNFFTGQWLALAEIVREGKPLSDQQWKRLFGNNTSPAILGSSTVWFPYCARLTPIQILSAVLFNSAVSKTHRAQCWNTYVPQVTPAEINALLRDKVSIVCADVFMLHWKGKPIHSYVKKLSNIQLYVYRSYTQLRLHKGAYNELFEQLQVIYPTWKPVYNYARESDFPCVLR